MNAKLANKTDNQSVESKKSYFESRMTELGITPEDYRMSVFEDDDSTTPKIKEIFSKDSKDNIRILYPNLDGGLYTYSADTKDNPEKTFYRTRLKIPQKNQKYNQKSSTGFYPFFPSKIVEKFTKKEEIKNSTDSPQKKDRPQITISQPTPSEPKQNEAPAEHNTYETPAESKPHENLAEPKRAEALSEREPKKEQQTASLQTTN